MAIAHHQLHRPVLPAPFKEGTEGNCSKSLSMVLFCPNVNLEVLWLLRGPSASRKNYNYILKISYVGAGGAGGEKYGVSQEHGAFDNFLAGLLMWVIFFFLVPAYVSAAFYKTLKSPNMGPAYLYPHGQMPT